MAQAATAPTTSDKKDLVTEYKPIGIAAVQAASRKQTADEVKTQRRLYIHTGD